MAELMSPTPGMVLRLREEEYRFGVGSITFQVIEVKGLLRLSDGLPWWHMRGESTPDASGFIGRNECELYVISNAIRRSGSAASAVPRYRPTP